MQPSEGIAGVILNQRECRVVKAELEAYPDSGSFGVDPDITSNLRRIQMIETASEGRLRQYTLPTDTAQKLGEEMLVRADACLPAPLITEYALATVVLGTRILETLHRAQQRRFARQLLEVSARSAYMVRERIQPQR